SEVFYLRQMKDSQAIRERIKRGKRSVVIGSGFIGMEVASVLASYRVHEPSGARTGRRPSLDFATCTVGSESSPKSPQPEVTGDHLRSAGLVPNFNSNETIAIIAPSTPGQTPVI